MALQSPSMDLFYALFISLVLLMKHCWDLTCCLAGSIEFGQCRSSYIWARGMEGSTPWIIFYVLALFSVVVSTGFALWTRGSSTNVLWLRVFSITAFVASVVLIFLEIWTFSVYIWEHSVNERSEPFSTPMQLVFACFLYSYFFIATARKLKEQKNVKQELARLQAVKETLTNLFHDQLLEEVCVFLVSEEKMKACYVEQKTTNNRFLDLVATGFVSFIFIAINSSLIDNCNAVEHCYAYLAPEGTPVILYLVVYCLAFLACTLGSLDFDKNFNSKYVYSVTILSCSALFFLFDCWNLIITLFAMLLGTGNTASNEHCRIQDRYLFELIMMIFIHFYFYFRPGKALYHELDQQSVIQAETDNKEVEEV